MKKKITLLLSALLIASLTACGTGEVAEDTISSKNTKESLVDEVEVEATDESVEVTEEDVVVSEEPVEEVVEEVTEDTSIESDGEESLDDAMADIQAMLEQAQKEAMEKAKQEAESQTDTSDSKYDFPEGYDYNKYTWRQTTADRDLYWMEGDKELIGKEFIGETFEEILQMAEDPTCDFDEANFWNATCMKGLTVKDMEYLVSKGYTVDDIINMVIENGVGNVYDLNIW